MMITIIKWPAVIVLLWFVFACGKKENAPEPKAFQFVSVNVNGKSSGTSYNDVGLLPSVTLNFSDAVNESSISSGISLKSGNTNIPFIHQLENNNTAVVISPADSLDGFSKYTVTVSDKLMSVSGKSLVSFINVNLNTGIDSSDKFARISDDELLTLVQRQTFKYFWDFAHPVSGLARERNTSGDIVTSGGSGFGIMAIITGIERNFISRAEGLARLTRIVSFLKNEAETFHGAYPHWLNGATGEAVAFSQNDNGADLVETSYLIQGLLTARQYFNGASAEELSLRSDINDIWQNVEWSWFRQNGRNVLYWHWSKDYGWDMNHPIQGWNECLITYVLAASSPSYPIPKTTYDSGWAGNGSMKNNSQYFGIKLPLGPSNGGPLFFAHYSFLGLDPNGLQDAYANYYEQNRAHSLINYNYCKANPKKYAGYSSAVWGLTASDNNKTGYSAHSPDNDLGVISPTAAISSMPYTPEESMEALKFFYYKLGDRIWKEYGFVDAFNISDVWFANSFLAIDQGPMIIMIENHRSKLLWNLFMSCPEVKTGLQKLSFQSPHF